MPRSTGKKARCRPAWPPISRKRKQEPPVAVPTGKKPTGAEITPVLAMLDQIGKDIREVHTNMSVVNCNRAPLQQHIKQQWQLILEQTDTRIQQAMAVLHELSKQGSE